MAGYSGTPLVQKIGIKPAHRVAIVGAPPGFDKELRPLPKDVVASTLQPLDVILLFAKDRAALEKNLAKLSAKMAPTGMLWVSWPKKSSGVATDLNENVVREIGIASGLVDVKVCAVNEIWSGLKFVIPVARRKQAAAGA